MPPVGILLLFVFVFGVFVAHGGEPLVDFLEVFTQSCECERLRVGDVTSEVVEDALQPEGHAGRDHRPAGRTRLAPTSTRRGRKKPASRRASSCRPRGGVEQTGTLAIVIARRRIRRANDMKAIQITEFGDADQLKYVDVPDPVAGAGAAGPRRSAISTARRSCGPIAPRRRRPTRR